MMLRLCIVVFLFTLNACSAISHSPAAATTEEKKVSALPYLAWWHKFNDATLNQLLNQALLYNNDLAIATKNIEVAQAELTTIQLSWIPGINLLAGFSQNPALGNPGVFYGIRPTYFINPFTTYYQQKTAKLVLEKTQIMQLSARLTVISQVTASYFSLLAWKDKFEILKKLAKNYRQLLDIKKHTEKLGLSNDIEVLTLASALQEVQGQQLIVEKNIMASENALRYLINQPPGVISTPSTFNQLAHQSINYGQINTQVLANRPDILFSFENLALQKSDIDISISKLLPAVTLDYFTGKASLDGSIKNPSHGVSFGEAYFTFNISPATFGNIAKNNAAFNKNLAEYNQNVQKALRELANSIDAYEKLTARYQIDKQALKILKNKYQLQKNMYDLGLISQNKLIMADIQINKLALKVNESKLEQLISIVMLYQQLGGGYRFHLPYKQI